MDSISVWIDVPDWPCYSFQLQWKVEKVNLGQ